MKVGMTVVNVCEADVLRLKASPQQFKQKVSFLTNDPIHGRSPVYNPSVVAYHEV